MKKLFLLFVGVLLSSTAMAKTANIWASIPFIRGADLCQYKQAFSQTRNEYMQEMVSMASQLMQSGAKGSEALQMMRSFDAMYDKNLALAKNGKYLDVTLENTLKAYLDSYYRKIPVAERAVQFKHINEIRHIVTTASAGQRVGYLPEGTYDKLDYVAYGSYAYAPNCKGNISVTITLVGEYGKTTSYKGLGKPDVVMSQIASRIFEDFQRTGFPKVLDMGYKKVMLLGATNGSVAKVRTVRQAQKACKAKGGRLPTGDELEEISAFGDWNGGVSIGNSVWAIKGYGGSEMVYHPGLMNPSPVRRVSEVNARVFNYYCIK